MTLFKCIFQLIVKKKFQIIFYVSGDEIFLTGTKFSIDISSARLVKTIQEANSAQILVDERGWVNGLSIMGHYY